MKKFCLLCLLCLFLGASNLLAFSEENTQYSSRQFLGYTFQTTQQRDEYKQLYEYNKWLEKQPDFPKYYSWYETKLSEHGLTRDKFNNLLYQYIMSGKSTFAKFQSIEKKWYLDFQLESKGIFGKNSLDDTITAVLTNTPLDDVRELASREDNTKNKPEIWQFILLIPLLLLLLLVFLRGIITITIFTFNNCTNLKVIFSAIAMIFAYILLPITLIIGIVNIIKNIQHKYFNKNRANNLIEDNEQKKLIIAYLIIPFLYFLQFAGHIKSTGVNSQSTAVLLTLLPIFLMTYLPPTIIRFLVLKGYILKQKIDIYKYMLLSLIIISALFFLVIKRTALPGILDFLATYFILSYKTLKDDWKIDAFLYAILYMVVWGIINTFSYNAIFVAYEIGGIIVNLIMLWILIFFSCPKYYLSEQSNITINTETDIKSNNTHEQHENTINKDLLLPPAPPEPCIPDDTPAGKLVCVGLAHIGRKTALKNKYITDESETERYSIERPFLDLLSAKFKEDAQRNILQENFILFKGACLLLIYRTLLKNNPEMKANVITTLQTLLSQNRTQADNQSRKEYLELFQKRFSYAYQKTKSTGKSLRYAFWNILAANYPDWVNRESVANIMNNDYLLKIFRYSYDALAAIDIVQFNKN